MVGDPGAEPPPQQTYPTPALQTGCIVAGKTYTHTLIPLTLVLSGELRGTGRQPCPPPLLHHSPKAGETINSPALRFLLLLQHLSVPEKKTVPWALTSLGRVERGQEPASLATCHPHPCMSQREGRRPEAGPPVLLTALTIHNPQHVQRSKSHT